MADGHQKNSSTPRGGEGLIIIVLILVSVGPAHINPHVILNHHGVIIITTSLTVLVSVIIIMVQGNIVSTMAGMQVMVLIPVSFDMGAMEAAVTRIIRGRMQQMPVLVPMCNVWL